MQFLSKFWSRKATEPNLAAALKKILGYTPKNISLYQKAFTHRSVNLKNSEGGSINFERLEFLGDAVIDAVVANYLFVTLKNDDEGELTRMKSKIVSREKLNSIGKKLQLLDFLICTGKKENFGVDIYGNLLEALIGASFIEKGYKGCKKIVFKLILDPHIDIAEVKKEIISYKSVLIEWGQKHKTSIEFLTEKENSKDLDINYRCQLFIDNKPLLKVREVSKKKVEEKAARRAFSILNIKQ